MTGTARRWPLMTHPVELIRAEERWPLRHLGRRRLRHRPRLLVWKMPTEHVAAVTDLDNGASITNSAEHIWAALADQYGEPLVLLEHYRADGIAEEHVDQVDMLDGQPRWRRICPTPPSHPQHHELRQWVAPLHELGGPW